MQAHTWASRPCGSPRCRASQGEGWSCCCCAAVRAHAAPVVQWRRRRAFLGQLGEHGLHDVVVVQAAEAGQLQQRLWSHRKRAVGAENKGCRHARCVQNGVMTSFLAVFKAVPQARGHYGSLILSQEERLWHMKSSFVQRGQQLMPGSITPTSF